MDNHVSKLLFGSFIITVFAYCIMAALALKNDNDVQTHVNNHMTTFIEKSQLSGYISAGNYEDLLSGLAQTGYLYDVNIYHESSYAFPESNGEYSNHYMVHSTDDILEEIYGGSQNEDYVMKNGDFLTVDVRIKNPPIGQKILHLYNKNIGGRYSGSIGNTKR